MMPGKELTLLAQSIPLGLTVQNENTSYVTIWRKSGTMNVPSNTTITVPYTDIPEDQPTDIQFRLYAKILSIQNLTKRSETSASQFYKVTDRTKPAFVHLSK